MGTRRHRLWRTNLHAAATSLWQNRLRTVLTILGILIGVASVVVVIAIGQGARYEVTREIESLGAHLVVVVPGKVQGGMGMSPMSSIGLSTITPADVAALKRHPDVVVAAPLMFLAGGVRRGEKWASISIPVATTPEFMQVRRLKMAEGRFLAAEDADRSVCVIGDTLRQELFAGRPALGNTIAVNQMIFRVIGVVAPRAQSDSLFGGNELDAIIYMPIGTVQRLAESRQIHRILAQINARDDPDAIVSRVRQTLLQAHGGVEDFSVLTAREILAMFHKVMNLLTAMLVGISSIALLVGGIGIMNIMLVSVTERTREIGIRKTVGARQRDIFGQFLTEAVALSLVGGALGLGLAIIACALAPRFTPLQPRITPGAVAIALGVCIGLGLIFGVTPAVRAARRDPIEALRHE
jgi:putative ABC transport system permease protein